MARLKQLKVSLVEGEYRNPLKGKVARPEQVYEIFRKIKDHAQETLIGVFLDGNLEARAYDVLSVGSGRETVVDPVFIFEHAILLRSKRFILIHNHPSGQPKPSPEDLLSIKALLAKAEVMEFTIMDFIIIGDLESPGKKSYWSLFEKQHGSGNEYTLGVAW